MEKLKVGDKVKTKCEYIGIPKGVGGRIVKVRNNDCYEVRIDKGFSNNDDYGWMYLSCELEKQSDELEKQSEPTTESQNKQILAYLQGGATINPITALNLFGSFRLSARINDLRKNGHNIKTTMVYNGRKKWANYNLEQ